MAGGFPFNTRRKVYQLPDITRPVGGGTMQLQIPKTGLIGALWLANRFTIAGLSGGPNALGKASILSRVRVSANSGVDLVNISGAGYHYLFRNVLDSEYIDATGQSDAKSAVANGAANLDMVLPLMLNPRDTPGMLLLQNEETILTIWIDFLADASVGTGVTVTGAVTPYVELFTVPEEAQDWPQLNVAHCILEDQQQMAAAGDYRYPWPRGNVYLRTLHGAGIGAAGSDNFDKVTWVVNHSDNIQVTDNKFLDMEQWRLRGRARTPGAILFDLLGTSGLGTFGLSRDIFDSSQITDMESVIHALAAGTLFTVREQLVPLAA
jgi:hypothetical protein